MGRRRLAVIAFAGHAPGLWLLARYKLDRATARLNLAAAMATIAAMAAAYLWSGWTATFIAWLVGHFTWSTILAARILRAEK